MRVSTLQQYLSGLAGPLRASGAAEKVLSDLEKTAQALEPFKDSEFEQLALFLQQAEAYRRDGTLPYPPKKVRQPAAPRTPKAPKPAPPSVAQLAQQVMRLKEQASDVNVKREQLAAELDRLNLPAFSKADLVALAREVGSVVTSKTTKDEAIKLVRRVVLMRKEEVESLSI